MFYYLSFFRLCSVSEFDSVVTEFELLSAVFLVTPNGIWFPLDVLLVAVLFQMRKLGFKFQLLPRMEGFKFAVPLNASTVIFFYQVR
jgi:hypothetical protein